MPSPKRQARLQAAKLRKAGLSGLQAGQSQAERRQAQRRTEPEISEQERDARLQEQAKQRTETLKAHVKERKKSEAEVEADENNAVDLLLSGPKEKRKVERIVMAAAVRKFGPPREEEEEAESGPPPEEEEEAESDDELSPPTKRAKISAEEEADSLFSGTETLEEDHVGSDYIFIDGLQFPIHHDGQFEGSYCRVLSRTPRANAATELRVKYVYEATIRVVDGVERPQIRVPPSKTVHLIDTIGFQIDGRQFIVYEAVVDEE